MLLEALVKVLVFYRSTSAGGDAFIYVYIRSYPSLTHPMNKRIVIIQVLGRGKPIVEEQMAEFLFQNERLVH